MKTLARALAATALLAALSPACFRLAPIEVKPIHITMDINIRVQKALDEDLSFQDEIEKQLQEELKKAEAKKKEGGSQ